MKNKVDFYVFSGTGNTLLVAEKITAVLRANNVDVNLCMLENSDPEKIDPEHALGLAFPVAAQGTYPFVWDFINKIPQSKGSGVFMVDTLAGMSGGIVGPLRKMITAKGYTPVGACEIIMPNNFLRSTQKDDKDSALIEKGLIAAEEFAEKLLAGKAKWGRVPLVSDIISLCSRYLYNGFPFVKRFFSPEIESEKCTRCGRCAKICPVGAIDLVNHKYILDTGKCEACMRCFAFCPSSAIKVRKSFSYCAVEYADFYRKFQ